MQLTTLLLPFLATATAVAAQNTVYLIRHGEKPSDGSDGLSAQGLQRAQCLRNVFGASSSYNIGYIIAEQPKSGIAHSIPSPHSVLLNSPKTTSQLKANDISRREPRAPSRNRPTTRHRPGSHRRHFL